MDELLSELDKWNINVADMLKYINQEDWEDPDLDDFDENEWENFIGSFELIDSGFKGDGQLFDIIFRYKDKYFKGYGKYSSWDSTRYNSDLVEVFPKQVTITEYVEQEDL
jgi:hypothetical protein